jgi:hypothetical protein
MSKASISLIHLGIFKFLIFAVREFKQLEQFGQNYSYTLFFIICRHDTKNV